MLFSGYFCVCKELFSTLPSCRWLLRRLPQLFFVRYYHHRKIGGRHGCYAPTTWEDISSSIVEEQLSCSIFFASFFSILSKIKFMIPYSESRKVNTCSSLSWVPRSPSISLQRSMDNIKDSRLSILSLCLWLMLLVPSTELITSDVLSAVIFSPSFSSSHHHIVSLLYPSPSPYQSPTPKI